MEGLEAPLTSIALCWRIERRDGVAIGLTSHDRDLVIEHLVYRAAPGMLPSAITRGEGAGDGAMEVAGALVSDGIAERDLIDGRWDGAEVTVFAVDWRAPGERLVIGGGRIGAVEMAGHGFTAELRGGAGGARRADERADFAGLSC